MNKDIKLIVQLINGYHLTNSEVDELTLYLNILNRLLEKRIEEKKYND